jgi:hypothetical protein
MRLQLRARKAKKRAMLTRPAWSGVPPWQPGPASERLPTPIIFHRVQSTDRQDLHRRPGELRHITGWPVRGLRQERTGWVNSIFAVGAVTGWQRTSPGLPLQLASTKITAETCLQLPAATACLGYTHAVGGDDRRIADENRRELCQVCPDRLRLKHLSSCQYNDIALKVFAREEGAVPKW